MLMEALIIYWSIACRAVEPRVTSTNQLLLLCSYVVVMHSTLPGVEGVQRARAPPPQL